ncbi:uncharacterized protein [Prorops nasuta]|uniref:uncharacterized protein n=1 Tax=Prorops nasuta TaxID=863751 RepID=UPI0034D00840
MKFLVAIALLVLQSVVVEAAKSSFKLSDDTVGPVGPVDSSINLYVWIASLKRLMLLFLLFFGIALYYIPESRYYARKAACLGIDSSANAFKTLLNLSEPLHSESSLQKTIKVSRKPKLEKISRVQHDSTFIISGSPREMAKLDVKSEKDDIDNIVILKDSNLTRKRVLNNVSLSRFFTNIDRQQHFNSVESNQSNTDDQEEQEEQEEEEKPFFIENVDDLPIFTNRLTPILRRTVQWFFGGCPAGAVGRMRQRKRRREEIEKSSARKKLPSSSSSCCSYGSGHVHL